MTTLIGIAGSLRRGSFNAGLLRAAAAACPAGTRIDICPLRGIPLYDGDVEENDGIPVAVAQLKDKIAAADGLVLSVPEYNNSMPGVLKNALDWLSRPWGEGMRVFGGKPVALMGASPSSAGTALAQASLLPVLRALGMLPWAGQRGPHIGRAGTVFDDNGDLVDEKIRRQLQDFMAGFAAFAARQAAAENSRPSP